MKIRVLLTLMLGLLVCTGAALLEDPQNLDQAVCPISGQPADAEQTAEWNGGTVYFCCPNCPGAFSESSDEYAAKANHQLVLTGQAEQTGCPISGQPCDEAQSSEVAGVTVCFCCENCKAAADGAEGDEQLEMLFGAEAFGQAYSVGSAE